MKHNCNVQHDPRGCNSHFSPNLSTLLTYVIQLCDGITATLNWIPDRNNQGYNLCNWRKWELDITIINMEGSPECKIATEGMLYHFNMLQFWTIKDVLYIIPHVWYCITGHIKRLQCLIIQPIKYSIIHFQQFFFEWNTHSASSKVCWVHEPVGDEILVHL